jgi:hypothetical protein
MAFVIRSMPPPLCKRGIKYVGVVATVISVVMAFVSIGVFIGQHYVTYNYYAAAVPLPSPTPAPVPTYSCSAPASWTGLAYARTWIQLGDSFAAGAGATVPDESSWMAQLRSLARIRLGSAPTVVNAVGTAADSLPEQIRLLRASAVWQQLLASREQALLFVSYGAEWLQTRANPDAALSTVVEHLALLVGATNVSLIPPDAVAQFGVVLIAHPDPTAGGVYVPADYALCADAPSLNWPTLASRAAHDQIYGGDGALHTHLRRLATRYGWAFVDTDAALGGSAWPAARAADGSAWRDCHSYNDRGHSLLAALLWACLQRTPYVIVGG